MEAAQRAYRRILAAATADPAVSGVVVVGPTAVGRLVHPGSDVDAYVITAGPSDPWRTRHGDPVELWPMTPTAFEIHGLTPDSAWDRPAFLRARVDLDRADGGIRRAVERKASLTAEEARATAHAALDQYVNSLYRSLRNLDGGRSLAGALDAVESLDPALTAIFAMEGRVRPFNKWLLDELERAPLGLGDPIGPIDAIRRHARPADQRSLFRRIETSARAAGHGPVIDAWEPDVAWLRGTARGDGAVVGHFCS